MRFKRPTQAIVAVRCPSCSNMFEVETAKLADEPIMAIVVEESPRKPKPQPPASSHTARPNSSQRRPANSQQSGVSPALPAATTNINGGSPSVDDIVEVEAIEVDSFDEGTIILGGDDDLVSVEAVGDVVDNSRSQWRQSTPEQTPTNESESKQRSRAAKLTVGTSKSVATNARSKSSMGLIVAAIGGIAVSIAGLIFAGIFLLGRSKNQGHLALVTNYETAMRDIQDELKKFPTDSDSEKLNLQIAKLQNCLLECVKAPIKPESELANLRQRVNDLSAMQVETKRLASMVPLSAARGTNLDQLTTLVDLVNRQLSYGIRDFSTNRDRSTKICRESFGYFRQLDQSLARSVATSSSPDLAEICRILDQLEGSVVQYGAMAEDRSELVFEQRQIFECGEAFRRWCYGQLQLKGFNSESQAVAKEIDSAKQRFDLALKATKLDAQSLTALDRINKRMSEYNSPTSSQPSNGQPSRGQSASGQPSNGQPVGGVPSSGPFAANGNSRNGNETTTTTASSGDSTSKPANSVASRSSDPTSLGFDATPPSRSQSDNFPSRPNGTGLNEREAKGSRDIVVSPVPGSSTTGTSSSSSPDNLGRPGGSNSAMGNNDSLSTILGNADQPPDFPQPRFQGPDVLTIKIVSNKSAVELKNLGVTVAARTGGNSQIQIVGNRATISINNYNRKVHEAIGLLPFGRVEISDSQSRTLFINDVE